MPCEGRAAWVCTLRNPHNPSGFMQGNFDGVPTIIRGCKRNLFSTLVLTLQAETRIKSLCFFSTRLFCLDFISVRSDLPVAPSSFVQSD